MKERRTPRKRSKPNTKLIRFRPEAKALIDDCVRRRGGHERRVFTSCVNDLIVGSAQFGPTAEAYISAQMKRTGKPRIVVIETAIIEEMRRRAETELLESEQKQVSDQQQQREE